MPFLGTLTFALVVSTIANMLSTVQDHYAQVLNLNAKMVILISCAGGIVSSAGLVAVTPMVHRKMEAALQAESRPDNLKALGKVWRLCRGVVGVGHVQAAWPSAAGQLCNSRYGAVPLPLFKCLQQASVHQVGRAALRPCCLGWGVPGWGRIHR